MPGRTFALLAAAWVACCFPSAVADQPQAVETRSELDPRGRMEGSPTDKPARYYVWHDQDGWHLRSCSRLVNQFQGTVRVSGGTIRKCRPIGLDLRGKQADRWGLSKDRRELTFHTFTSTSFDGFDFNVDAPDATLEFELLINEKKMPRRIFIGRNGAHPADVKFTFPGGPEPKGDRQ
jgi:hypothetical protein